MVIPFRSPQSSEGYRQVEWGLAAWVRSDRWPPATRGSLKLSHGAGTAAPQR